MPLLLFLLYLVTLIRIANSRICFRYTDDIGILGIDRTILHLAAVAQREVNNLLGWANEKAVTFNLVKIKVNQFPECGRESIVRVTLNGISFEPVEHNRCIGIYLDSKLSFRHHVETYCS